MRFSVNHWYWTVILLLLATLFCALVSVIRMKRRCGAADRKCENYAMLTGLSKLDCFILKSDGEFLTPLRSDTAWKFRNGVPLPPEEWIHPDDLEGFLHKLHSLKNEEKNYIQYTYRIPESGGDSYFLLQALAFGPDRMIFGCVQDVTPTMRKEMHLHDMQRLVQEVVDNLPYPIFAKEVDEDFRYHFLNKAFCDHFGRKAKNAVGKTDLEIFPDRAEAQAIRDTDSELVDSGETQKEYIEHHKLPDGSEFRCRTLKKIVKFGDGTRMLLGISIDIAQEEAAKRVLQNALDKAEALNRAKSYFFASMSHEIRTPLNAVIGFTELLKDEALPVPVRKQYLDNITFAAQALLQLINDLLDLSKLEAEQMILSPGATDVTEICRTLCNVFNVEAHRRNLQLRSVINPMPPMRLDQLRLRQILLNLMGNALKFTPKGSVELSASFTADDDGKRGTLVLSVSDTGVGIPEEDRKNIFIPFVQAKAMRGTSAANNGTGLGLAIIARLLQKMDGEIALESTPGKGSRFTVTLRHVPVASRDELKKQNAGTNTENNIGKLAGLRVLLVDDVRMNLTVLRALCIKLGIRSVNEAASGADALQLLRSKPFDLVLTDMWMPGMNGSELAEIIKKDPVLQNIPVAAVTADIEPGSTFPMSAFSGFLLKPVTLDKLRTALNDLPLKP